MTFDLPVLAPEPGTFAFACNRCGNCCSNQSGYVWVTAEECGAIAAALGMTTEAFARRHVRRVGERLSLVEEGGRCSLLLGKNECGAYAARPEQCRTFPFWPEVLEGGEAYTAARETCPGILEVPPREAREAAYLRLRELYARVDAEIAVLRPRCEMSGNCCDFPTAGHRLFATTLEVDFAAEGTGTASRREHVPLSDSGDHADLLCPFWVQRRCTARDTRPLACRTYYCDVTTTAPLLELHDRWLARVRDLAREVGYPAGYGDFVEMLPARRAAIEMWDRARGSRAEATA